MYFYCVNDILEGIRRDSRTFSRKSKNTMKSESLIN